MGGCCSSSEDSDVRSGSPPVDNPAGLPTVTQFTDLMLLDFLSGNNHRLLGKQHLAWKAEVPTTALMLKRQREEFWDTSPSYSGSAHIWVALRAACEASTLEEAQEILDTNHMTVPTGKLSDGCYDELGAHYRIPLYCILDPTNVSPPFDATSTPTGAAASSSTPIGQSPPSSQNPRSPLSAVSGSPPSASANRKTPTSLVARLNVGRDVKVPSIPVDATVADLRSLIAADPASELKGCTTKFFYLGRQLEDIMFLADIHVPDGGVLQVMVSPPR
ncbi:Ubiquitin domain-containing protein 2 [Thoreauomyces humboldtii]|nr:Ubiquitin domain-containing protein 2 [Thoreauomyces humboldtii]